MNDYAALAIVLMIFFVSLGIALEHLIDAVAQHIADKIKDEKNDSKKPR